MSGTVLDASVLAELVIDSPLGRRVAATLPARRAAGLNVPHLAIVETASVLRHLTRAGRLTAERAELAVHDLAALPCNRWPADRLLPRIWDLRNNVTSYDATYLALAEALDADLLTADRRLARAAADAAACSVTVVA